MKGLQHFVERSLPNTQVIFDTLPNGYIKRVFQPMCSMIMIFFVCFDVMYSGEYNVFDVTLSVYYDNLKATNLVYFMS
jgi:hypothetical protein